MRLSPFWRNVEVRAGLARLLDPPFAENKVDRPLRRAMPKINWLSPQILPNRRTNSRARALLIRWVTSSEYAIISLLKLCVELSDTSDVRKRRLSFSMVYAA